MRQAVRVVGWLWIALGLASTGFSLYIVAEIVVVRAAGSENAGLVGAYLIIGIASLAGVVAGYGLMRWWLWARVLILFLSGCVALYSTCGGILHIVYPRAGFHPLVALAGAALGIGSFVVVMQRWTEISVEGDAALP